MRLTLVGLAMIVLTLPLTGQEKLTGDIKITGSSAVYLPSEQVASYFKKLHPDSNLTVGICGTGGGFKKFAAGECDITNASRPIKPEEAERCKQNGIEYVEVRVGFDALALIVHKDNDWARQLTVEQLRKIWHPDTDAFQNARKWSDVDPQWPDKKIVLLGSGPDSLVFDCFTEAINGKMGLIRTDYESVDGDD